MIRDEILESIDSISCVENESNMLVMESLIESMKKTM